MVSGIGTLPRVTGWLVDCPQGWLFPNAGGWDAAMEVPVPWATNYQGVIDNHADYQGVVDVHEDYAGLLDPVADPDNLTPAPNSGGYGWVGGVSTVGGVEVWITDVEGWDSGPTLSVQSSDPGLLVGTHVSSVLGRGRTVTVKGVLLDPSGGGGLPLARQYLAAALATPPHRGWFTIDDLWLPVVMDGQVKQRQVDGQRVDFEFTLRGRDGVSAGHGVHLETHPTEYVELTNASSVAFLDNSDGFVGMSPVVNWKPADATSTATLRFESLGGTSGANMLFTSEGLGVSADRWLRVDMSHHRVDVMGPLRAMGSGRVNVDWGNSEWLEVPPGGCMASMAITAGPTTSTVDVSWMKLL